MKARIFNIMQYVNHPETGEPLLSEDKIQETIQRKGIKEWAYILHDKDHYSQADEEINPDHTQDKVKPPHWHIVLQCSYAVEVSVIAKWLGIPENFVDVPKGNGAGKFLDCVEYLTHESVKQQELGKHRYDDNEVKASFDFRTKLDKRNANKIKYGRDLSDADQMFYDVMYLGKTLRQCEAENPLLYMDKLEKLKKYRLDYIQNRAQVPDFRINYYVDGLGGIGKNTASKALARSLYPELVEEDCYFEVGGDKVSLDGYDGQPVIIWNDRRAYNFIATWGKGETFDIFDSHPTGSRHNIKYGSLKLINAVNIVNGVEPYTDFLDGLVGEYTSRDGVEHKVEDKGQSYRRFPIILCLRENDFDVLLNKGIARGTREYTQYVGYKNIVGNFGRVAERLSDKAQEVVMIDMLKPAIDCTEKVKAKEQTKISDPDMIPEEFKQYGKKQKFDIPNDELPFPFDKEEDYQKWAKENEQMKLEDIE